MSAKLTNRDVILYINYLYKFMLRIVEVFKAQPGASHQQPPTFVIFTLKKVRKWDCRLAEYLAVKVLAHARALLWAAQTH